MARELHEAVDEVIRDLDLVVYRLERPPPHEAQLEAERVAIRREIERLRDRLADLLPGI